MINSNLQIQIKEENSHHQGNLSLKQCRGTGLERPVQGPAAGRSAPRWCLQAERCCWCWSPLGRALEALRWSAAALWLLLPSWRRPRISHSGPRAAGRTWRRTSWRAGQSRQTAGGAPFLATHSRSGRRSETTVSGLSAPAGVRRQWVRLVCVHQSGCWLGTKQDAELASFLFPAS